MSQPEIVQSGLDGEAVVARVDLGGEDELYVTPTRTLCYRAEGLLSDESVEEYPHGAERITVSEGRRKAKVTLDYGLDGERTVSLPASRLERALTPIVEGVLKHNGVLDAEESVAQLFRFNESTIVVASERVVRHIGPGLWDEEFESYHYGDVTDLEFEDGNVNTSAVLTVGGQRERFKTPNQDARAVRSALEATLLSYWEVDSIEELREATAPEESSPDADPAEGAEEVSFGDGPDPLFADPTEPDELPDNATRAPDDGEAPDPAETPEAGTAASQDAVEADATAPDADALGRSDPGETTDAGAPAGSSGAETAATQRSNVDSEPTGSAAADATTRGGEAGGNGGATGESPGAGFEGSGFEAAAPETDEQILDELASLREVVERQNEELTAQRELLEQLIEELRRGR